MNCHAVPRVLVLAGMLAASSAFAGTEVIKCTDQAGHVTLTDQPCQRGSQQLPLRPAAQWPAADRTEPERYQIAALPPARRALPAVRNAPPGQVLARDVITLKIARLNMLLMDSGAAALRHQRIAGH